MENELNPTHWAQEFGDYLFRFALLRIDDQDAAKDLVQETFISALKSKDNFKGNSSVKTWLTAILKHKILDFYRKSQRETPLSQIAGESQSTDEITHQLFEKNGHWSRSISPWQSSADEILKQKQNAQLIQKCMEGLAEKYRRVFILREIDEIGTDEICNELSITSSNLWVILHRARLQMQKCLSGLLSR